MVGVEIFVFLGALIISSSIRSRRFLGLPNQDDAVRSLSEIARQPVDCLPRKVDKALVLYGAGAFGKLAKQYCDRVGIPVSFVVDSDVDRHRADSFWFGVKLLGLNEATEVDKASFLLAICVGNSPYTEVIAPLLARGWLDIVPFYAITAAYIDRHPLGNGWFAGNLSRSDLDGMEFVLSRYDDDTSRAHHLQFLAWHRLQEEWFFDDAPVVTDNRYFIPELVRGLHEEEIFIDLGAHHGTASERFLRLVSERFKQLWAIEPDTENLAHLRRSLNAYAPEVRQRMRVLSCAIGCENQSRTFYEGLDFASQFCSYGNTHVVVKTLDALDIKPTFIKAHLEGAEMEALISGTKTIRNHRPLIALSVYHNRLGLWECQKSLMDTFGDCGYRFLFRLHCWHGTGAVLYLLNR